MEYNFKEIEAKWQSRWRADKTYKVETDPSRPKFYVLDMFPYPSGAGLHVGHPLGYIASDIYSRYKRLKGFNVLHPMGYDAFGLPAEQYAIQTGQHPAVTTEQNIARYREQLDKIGFSFDWDREVRTCDPGYYKWTQWAFLEMFSHWYDRSKQQARPVAELTAAFETSGTEGLDAACTTEMHFTAAEWNAKSEREKEQILQNYRLAFRADTQVNWCPKLGTVLANDEVHDGLSVRGGYPVEQKRMKQWLLRVTAYAQRMLDGLDKLEWSDSLKEIQRNWIGRSEGAQVFFDIENSDRKLEIFTTRPDTIFGVTFMVIAPEHEWVGELTTPENKAAVEEYIRQTKKRSERDRIADTKRVSGVATGSYAINPFTNKAIPIYISDYVLSGYGTGAIMAVPAHDSRDWAFARHFGLEIVPVVEGGDIEKESYDAKTGKVINSDFLNGMDVKEAIQVMFAEVEKRGLGKKLVNYRLRDAIFSRQRYWGEPFPIYYKNDTAYPLAEDKLPLELPPIENFGPTAEGEPPLARVKGWATPEGCPYELSTMPGFAGSSAYYLRYMDPHNDEALVGKEADEYWRNVDLYVGGIEHATGHLMYSRFWNMFLYDLGCVCEEEPFRKLVNQGMIQGRSNFVYRIVGTNRFVSLGLKDQYETQALYVDVNIVRNDILDLDAFRAWMPEYKDAEFILEDGKYVCGWAIEKMSKSFYNVVNPDYIVDNRRRHAAHVRDVPRAAGAVETLGHERHRRRAQIPAPLLAPVLRPRRAAVRHGRKGDRAGVAHPPQDHQKGLGGHRELLVQHLRGGLYDLPQRAGRVFEARSARTADRAARPLRPAHRRGAVGRARTHRIGLHGLLSGLRRDAPRAELVRIPRVGQRQAPLPEGVCRFDDARRDSGRRRHGPRGAEMARRQNPEKDHRRAGQDHKHRDLTPRHA